MNAAVGPLLVGAALCVASVQPQPTGPTPRRVPPNLLGRWILVVEQDPSPTTESARELVVGESSDGPFQVATIERVFANDVRTERHSISLQGELVNVNPPGRAGPVSSSNYSTRIEGDRLVIEFGSRVREAWKTLTFWQHREIWEVDANGDLVVATTDESSDAASKTFRTRYRRP